MKRFVIIFIFLFFIISNLSSENIKSSVFAEADSAFQENISSHSLASITLKIAIRNQNIFEKGIAYSNIATAYFYNDSVNIDSAYNYTFKSINLLKKNNAFKELAIMYNHLAILYMYQNYNLEAIQNLQKAANLFEKIKDVENLSNVQLNIGNIYSELSEYKKSKEYLFKSLRNANKLNNYDKSYIWAGLGVLYTKIGNYKKSLEYLNKALIIYEFDENNIEIIKTEVIISNNYSELQTPNKSLEHILRAYGLSKKINDSLYIGYTSNFIGDVYLDLNKLDSAKKFLEKGLRIFEKINEMELIQNSYYSHYFLYKQQQNYNKALEYFEKFTMIRDSLIEISNKDKIFELETIYQTDKKNRRIKRLASEKRISLLKIKQKNITILLISVLAIIIIISLIILIISFKKKQRIKQELIQEKASLKIAETEQKMLASIIETEDSERKRFAEDLHDGLGPLLSTIKLYVGELKRNDNTEIITLLNSIINDAIKNIRSISYNIMPVELTKNGIDYAIRTFCYKITLVKPIEIIIKGNIENKKFKWTLEKIIYRVLTELVNNTLKHTNATKISISMLLQNNTLSIKYVDDGGGFNIDEKLNNITSGLGLKNIINRIKIIDGLVKFNSDNTGSVFIIKINI